MVITRATSPSISPSEGPRGGSSGGSPSSVVALELSRLSLFHLPPVFWWSCSGLSAVVNAVSPVSKSNVAERPCISYCTRWVVSVTLLEDNIIGLIISLSLPVCHHRPGRTRQAINWWDMMMVVTVVTMMTVMVTRDTNCGGVVSSCQ